MTRALLLRWSCAAVGIVVWGIGARWDNPRLRVTGMIVLGIALLLRWMPASIKARIDGENA